MAESSRTFNFDDFDQQIADALAKNDEEMGDLLPLRRPGEIGGVAISPLYREWFGDELPPDDAA